MPSSAASASAFLFFLPNVFPSARLVFLCPFFRTPVLLGAVDFQWRFRNKKSPHEIGGMERMRIYFNLVSLTVAEANHTVRHFGNFLIVRDDYE